MRVGCPRVQNVGGNDVVVAGLPRSAFYRRYRRRLTDAGIVVTRWRATAVAVDGRTPVQLGTSAASDEPN